MFKSKKFTVFQLCAVILSLVLMAIALTKPSFNLEGQPVDDGSKTWLLFFLGWAGLFVGNVTPTLIWLANPLYILCLIFIYHGRKLYAVIFGFIAFFAALSFFMLDTIMVGESGMVSAKIISLEAGYYLWISSLGISALSTLTAYFQDKKI